MVWGSGGVDYCGVLWAGFSEISFIKLASSLFKFWFLSGRVSCRHCFDYNPKTVSLGPGICLVSCCAGGFPTAFAGAKFALESISFIFFQSLIFSVRQVGVEKSLSCTLNQCEIRSCTWKCARTRKNGAFDKGLKERNSIFYRRSEQFSRRVMIG